MFKFARAVLSVALLAGTVANAQTAVTPSGDGTVGSPFQITELGNLVWMGEHVSESAGMHYRLMNDIDASSCEGYWDYGFNNQFATGIWLGGFDPVGGDDGSFCGVFDGGGHVVRGVRVGDRSLAGLFGCVGEGGQICNLGVNGAYMNGSVVGGIAAVVDGGAISNCWVSGILCGYSTVGGIAGEVYRGTVFRCYATGACQQLAGSSGRFGGAVAECLLEAVVAECYAAVALKGETTGGLIACGSDQFLVTDSYWDVEVSESGTSWLGGEGKTSAEMRHAATFAGWDFTNVWDIAEGASTPYLRMFPPPFTLSVATQGAGRVEIVPQKAAYQPGERVTLTAYSDASGYVFSHWAGGESNLLTTVTAVTMDNHRALLAVFVPATDISTVEELQAIGGANNYRLAQDIDATATTNWNGGAGFSPIGGSYTGIFDGNGHEVRSLTINRPGQDGVGLFVEVDEGLIRRMGFEGGRIIGGQFVGALSGHVTAGRLEQCFSSCDVSGASVVGGLVGITWAVGKIGRFIKCSATANVTALGLDPWNMSTAGGLVGCLDHADLEDCFASGNVYASHFAGGLIGENGYSLELGFNRIVRCFASGNVIGHDTLGGLIGHGGGYALIRSCFATGSVRGSYVDVGGLVGYGGRESFLLPDGTRVTAISESYAVGRLVRFEGDDGTLTGGNDFCWSPAAYWDLETTWTSPSSFGFGKSTAQMKQMATYEGWDFTNVWGIAEGVSYPYLRGVGTPFMLRVVTEGPGRVTVSPQKPFYLPGEVVTLTAIPDAATNMLGWWVGLVADEDAVVTTVTMDIHKTVTAVFVTPKDIASIEELQKIGNDSAYPFDGAYRLTQDIDARATTNWNAGAGFLPLAQGIWPGFAGLIDGQGHAIRGLAINRPGEGDVGLIGSLGLNGLIRNVGVVNCSIVGGGHVGGLIGNNLWGRVARSFVEGSVGGGGLQGGLVGRNEGALSKCYMSGAVSATNRAGGLVGGQYYRGRVCESYAAASVSGGSAAGGLVGVVDEFSYGIVTQSYWDVEASGCAVSAGGEGKTTAEMMRQATYAGWDFSTEWGIDEGTGYPFLWQFLLKLPPGVGAADGTNRPAYAAWAASHANAWGTADFSGMPAQDFEAAWLLDRQPAAGLADGTDFTVAGFEVGEAEICVTLALTASGAAKQGAVNGWVAVEGQADLSDGWAVVATQQAGEGRIVFADGLATVVFVRPEGCRFFRPVLSPTHHPAPVELRQIAP